MIGVGRGGGGRGANQVSAGARLGRLWLRGPGGRRPFAARGRGLRCPLPGARGNALRRRLADQRRRRGGRPALARECRIPSWRAAFGAGRVRRVVFHHHPSQRHRAIRRPDRQRRLGDELAQRVGREAHGQARLALGGDEAVALVVAFWRGEGGGDGRFTGHLGEPREPCQHGVEGPLGGGVAVRRGAGRHGRFHLIQPLQHGAVAGQGATHRCARGDGVAVSSQDGGPS